MGMYNEIREMMNTSRTQIEKFADAPAATPGAMRKQMKKIVSVLKNSWFLCDKIIKKSQKDMKKLKPEEKNKKIEYESTLKKAYVMKDSIGAAHKKGKSAGL